MAPAQECEECTAAPMVGIRAARIPDGERPVPMLELRLSDLDGKLVQSANTAPLKKQLTAGDQIGFKIQVEDPSPLARRLEVTFIERGGDGAPNAAQ